MSKLVFNKSKKLDFVAIGRLCLDFNVNEINRPMEEASSFTRYLGGSPANITVAMSRFGMKTGFIGKISDDSFGRYIRKYLKENHIDTSNVITDSSGGSTGLAFTEIKSPRECSILMYRDNVADLQLEPGDISEEYIANTAALLISGTALSKSPSREAVFLALEYAHKHGVVVLFDLDYRPYTWVSEEETAIYYNLVAEKSHVIFGTRDEFDIMEHMIFPGNKDDSLTTGRWLERMTELVVVKHGKEGSVAYTREGEIFKGAVFPAKIVKTFGAGDSYAGAFIYSMMQGKTVDKALEAGSAAASLVISSHSCSDAMPTAEQIESFISRCKSGEIYKEEGWVL